MQAVILAAGNGTRLRPITNHVPKPMIKIGNKTLLEYNIDNLPSEVDEIIFVIGYLGEQIKDYFGSEFKGKKIKYVEQKELLGIFFYLLYGITYVIKMFKYGKNAYYNLAAEREAYKFDDNLAYLNVRKRYFWLTYIFRK